MSQDWYQDVLDFHRKFGCAIGEKPSDTTRGVAILREKLIREELQELIDAMWAKRLPDVADACADLIYVVLGTAISYGIDLRPIWEAVQAANMGKEGGGERADGKILKPEGWQAPNIEQLLREQGWEA